jgi:hypothetical protein
MRNPHRSLTAFAAMTAILSVSAFVPSADAGCSIVPRPVCRDLAQSKLDVDSYGHVSWKASHGPATTLDDFGDPGETSHYFLCAWDERGLLVAADIPPAAECPGGSCWCEADKTGLKYKDEAGYNGDLRALQLLSNEKVGARISAETLVIGGINLPVAGDVLVQLSRSDSDICFESLVPAESFTSNSSTSASARMSAADRKTAD